MTGRQPPAGGVKDEGKWISHDAAIVSDPGPHDTPSGGAK